MAKAAVHDSLSNSIPFGRVVSKVQAGTKMKRKTPSELRGEQLKRKSCATVLEELPASLLGSEMNSGEMVRGFKKPETKTPRYINTRVDEVYPARKLSNRLTLLHEKEKTKDNIPSEQSINLKDFSVTSKLDTNSQPQLARYLLCSKYVCQESSAASVASGNDCIAQACSVTEKCSQNTFRTVAEISLGSEKSSAAAFDLAALKTLGAREPSGITHLSKESSERFGDLPSVHTSNFSREFHIAGYKTPLDLTLKTSLRLFSSSSVNWCHRLTTSSNYNGITQLTSQCASYGNENACPNSGTTSAATALFSRSLHSWVYPQSSLPPAVISALNISAGQGEVDFLMKRQEAWEDSFRSIYYMLRKNACNIFYVCTSQFVVLFTGSDYVGKTKQTCNAYVSQSTRGLRSLLREHDISFSMPLCHSEAEHATAEDLVELTEIGKHNLGQTRRVDSISDIDNSNKSLLAFTGNESVHGLYDFLLNYRSFLSTLVGVDVPVLYAPVPFQNASVSVPEVKCKELKRVTSALSTLNGSHTEDGETVQDSSLGMSYIIEIKGTVLPPWVICGICTSMGFEGRSFDASFTPDPISIGLNIALGTICKKSCTNTDEGKALQERTQTFGISEAVVAPCLQTASLRGLKYSNGSYTACMSPL